MSDYVRITADTPAGLVYFQQPLVINGDDDTVTDSTATGGTLTLDIGDGTSSTS